MMQNNRYKKTKSKRSKLTRLTDDDFVRNNLTFTERLTKEDIKAKLENYNRIENVEELENVPIGTHMRYFKYEDGHYKFRMGGILMNKKEAKKYIVLANNGKTWCASTKKCKFFSKKSNKDLERRYNNVIKRQHKEISNIKNRDSKSKNIVKYDNIDGVLMDPCKIKPNDYIVVANKRRKRIYQVITVYQVRQIDGQVISVNGITSHLDDFSYNIDDHWFYKVVPKKNAPIRATQRKLNTMT